MDRSNVQALCSFLADICGLKYHEVSWQGRIQEKADQTAMMVLVQNRCLSSLRARLDRGDGMMEYIGITRVCIMKSTEAMDAETSANIMGIVYRN
jgi:hypothetical protein